MSNTVKKEDVNFLKKFTREHPETEGMFIDLRFNDKYQTIDGEIKSVGSEEFTAAIKPLENDSSPALGYNNGVYCLTCYEDMPGQKGCYFPHSFVFLNKNIAEELLAQGVRNVGADYYVPLSNGEFALTIPNTNALKQTAEVELQKKDANQEEKTQQNISPAVLNKIRDSRLM